MRIGFLLDGFTGGGTARAASLLGNAWVKAGLHEAFALAYTRDGLPDAYQTDFPVEYAYQDHPSMRKAILQRHYLARVRDFVSRHAVQAVIACGVQYFPIAVWAAKRMNVRSVCWEHTAPERTGDFRFQGLCRKIGGRYSDCNVVLTRAALVSYERMFPCRRIVQIYHPAPPALLARRRPYSAESKRIISVGRLCEAKDFERLIRVAREALRGQGDWTWDIFGEGEKRQTLEALIREAGLQGQVTLRGQAADLYDRYGDYACLVMTSRYEGFPMALLEGAAAGLPLLAFDVPTGPGEIIENGVNGYLCDPGSDGEMIAGLRALMEDAGLRQRMAEESLRVGGRFSMAAALASWGQALEALSGEK